MWISKNGYQKLVERIERLENESCINFSIDAECFTGHKYCGFHVPINKLVCEIANHFRFNYSPGTQPSIDPPREKKGK